MTRIGIIGAGPNGTGHAKYYRDCPRAHLVAIADPDQARATALATEFGGRAVADFRDFLDAVDAVVVASPNFLHREQAVACAAAGKHVFCEKPPGLSAAEAGEIAAAVAAAGVRSMIGFSVRWTDNIQTILRLAGEGAFGDPISLWSRRLGYSRRVETGWRGDHGKSGGLLLEINIHELDWLMALGGDVVSVYARMRAEKPLHPRSNDHLWIVLNFAAGAVGTHEGSWLAATPNYFRGVHGTAGGAYTDEWGQGLMAAKIGAAAAPFPVDPRGDPRGHFLDCIANGARPVADAAWGAKVMAVVEACFASAQSGLPAPVAPATAG